MSLIEKMKKNKLIKNNMLSEKSVEQGYISTGCLSLNVLFSGKLDGGIVIGKMNQIVAPSSLGKCARHNQEIDIYVPDEVYEKYFR